MTENTIIVAPIAVTREGPRLRFSFTYDKEIVDLCKTLPYAEYDKITKAWFCDLSEKSFEILQAWYAKNLVNIHPQELLAPDEVLSVHQNAKLIPGTAKRPYRVKLGDRSEGNYSRFKNITGAFWDKNSSTLSYPPLASAVLSDMIKRGLLADPGKLLKPADVTIYFDTRKGAFGINGDPRAQVAFDKFFPREDVYSKWLEKDLDVAFLDRDSEEIYRGERARLVSLQPEGLQLPLFQYQAENVSIAVERTGFAVLDAPGLGKTATGIAWAHELMNNRKEAARAVIVVPGAVRTQWAREIARFIGLKTDASGMPTEKVTVISGTKKQREERYAEAKNSSWVILNYDLLTLDKDFISPLVKDSLLIADEAHRLKSYAAKRTKRMSELSGIAKRRLALTGTPVDNSPEEWYALISGFTNPGLFGSPVDYLERYRYPNMWGGYEGARNLIELRERSRVHYSRHTKEQVATHLPPLRIQHSPLDIEPSYAKALLRAHKEARAEIVNAIHEKVEEANIELDDERWEELEGSAEMTAVGMLRLMCLSPRLVLASEASSAQALKNSGLIPDIDGPKLDELRTIALEMQAEDERLVVFTFSKSMVKLITQRFDEDGVRYVTFTGSENSKDRDAAVLAFTTDGDEENPAPTVFIATDAGAEGLNLGKRCSTLINLDIPWTPGRFEQRSNRIHRIDGKSDHYLVKNLTLRGTVEEGILRMVEHKADLVDAIFGESNGRLKTTGRRGYSIFKDAMEEYA